jgi:general secretion pathway protein G
MVMLPYRFNRRLLGGFTLAEMLVVLSIIALLLTLSMPRYYAKVDAAKEAVLLENLRMTREVIGKYFADTGRYPESLQELVDRKYLMNVPFDPIADSSTSWAVVPVPEGIRGGVFDIRSGANGVGRNGKPYEEW